MSNFQATEAVITYVFYGSACTEAKGWLSLFRKTKELFDAQCSSYVEIPVSDLLIVDQTIL